MKQRLGRAFRRAMPMTGIVRGALFALLVLSVSVGIAIQRAGTALAATPICGTLLAGTTTWTNAGNPFEICQSGLTVPAGATLVIDGSLGPVVVNALGFASGGITVLGGALLTANTTPVNNVTFSGPTVTPGSWAGLSFRQDGVGNKGNGSLSNVTISSAVTATFMDSGATSTVGSSSFGLVLNNVAIRDTSSYAVYANPGGLSVTGGSISNYGLYGIVGGGDLTVSGVTIMNTIPSYVYAGIAGGGGRVVSITNNTIDGAGTYGINISGPSNVAPASFTLTGNTVKNSGLAIPGIRPAGPAILLDRITASLGPGADIDNNHGFGNGLDTIAFDGTVTNSFSWLTPTNSASDHVLGYTIVNGLTVTSGNTVTLPANAIVKTFYGVLTFSGSALDATAGGATLTSLRDSTVGLVECPSALVPSVYTCTPDAGQLALVFTRDPTTGARGNGALSGATVKFTQINVDSGATSAPGNPEFALAVAGSTIRGTSGHGIFATSSRISVTNTTIDVGGHGISVNRSNGNLFSDVVIQTAGGSGIDLSEASAAISRSRFTNVGGQSGAFAINANETDLRSTIVVDCSSIHGNTGGVHVTFTPGSAIRDSDLFGNTGVGSFDLDNGGPSPVMVGARSNWWGQSSGPIAGQISNPADADTSGFLSSQTPTVTVGLSSTNTKANGNFGAGTLTVTLVFSREMATSIQPTVVINPGAHAVTGNWQSDKKTWVGTYAMSPTTVTAGSNMVTATEARSCVNDPATNQIASTSASFTAAFSLASVVTDPATAITTTSATLNGTINPNGSATSGFFRIGTASGVYTMTTPSQSVGNGTAPVSLSAPLTGLAPSTPYFFVAVATTGDGESTGAERTFTTAATTFVVNAADDVDHGVCDAAHCSLREAINAANAAPGVDNITFNIPGAAPHTIQPTSELPAISDPVVIDGGTAPSCAGTPGIELDGSSAGFAFGLVIDAGPSTVRGLVINRFSTFPRAGIWLRGNGGNVVQCSYIGTDLTGTAARGNNQGVLIHSPNNLIGGTTAAARNIISGNDDAGVRIEDNFIGVVTNFATGNVVSGNYIGTDVTGTIAVGNHFQGVFVNGPSGNVVGGSAAGAGNVISGNHGTGVAVGSSDNFVQGNLIGTNASGTAALGNDSAGVIVDAGRNNTIGGSSAAARNVISANGQYGLEVCCQNTSANIIRGNYIGTNAAGTVALPNAFAGVLLNGGTKDNVIGGPSAGDGNLVSGNAGEGVWLDGVDVTGNSVQGNRIGVQSDGTSPLGNTLDGILLNSASANTIGGSANAGNRIAFNGRHGVAVAEFGGRCCSLGDTISGNSILSNGGLGIDLGFDGVTLNDPGDADSGPNDLQNFPVLTAVTSGGATTTLVGTLNSTPLTTFRLEFFTSGTCDATGYGEGESFLGAATTVTDAAGNASFSASFPSAVAPGRSATTTATDPAGNTSEFSLCRAVTSTVNGPPATVTLTPPTATNTVGQQHCVTTTVTDTFGNPVSGVSVVFSVSGTNSAGPTTKTTGASGQAQFCYTGTKAGGDTIRAFADTNGNGSQDIGEPTGAATKTYLAAAPATLVLSPATASNIVGTQHCVTATVTDAFGNPTPNHVVRFSVRGGVYTSGIRTTDANGQATFCYQGPEVTASDFITAYADSNANNTQDAGEPSGAATKTWVLPVSTPLCTVTITEGSRITANNGDKATFGGNAKVSKSGNPSGSEQYQDYGPAFAFRVQSVNILAVTCSADGKQASIYGLATINGGRGRYQFKVDVKDLGDPGVGKDTYRIVLPPFNGYDSGEHTLEAGDIQIRIG